MGLAIIAAYGLTRSEQSPRLGIIMHRFRIRERGKHDFRIGTDTSFCRIRDREVQEFVPRAARFLERLREWILSEPPVCSLREHKSQWRTRVFWPGRLYYFRKNPSCSGGGKVLVRQY